MAWSAALPTFACGTIGIERCTQREAEAEAGVAYLHLHTRPQTIGHAAFILKHTADRKQQLICVRRKGLHLVLLPPSHRERPCSGPAYVCLPPQVKTCDAVMTAFSRFT